VLEYLTADWHVGHRNILRFCDRPFEGIVEHDKALLAAGLKAPPGSHVGFLGDLSLGASAGYLAGFLHELMAGGAHWHMVRGNHDQRTTSWYLRHGFASVTDALVVDGVYHVHRPQDGLGDRIAHGHTHSTSRGCDRRFHVGVDAWDYQLAPGTRSWPRP